jgi:hypothetical protein
MHLPTYEQMFQPLLIQGEEGFSVWYSATANSWFSVVAIGQPFGFLLISLDIN